MSRSVSNNFLSTTVQFLISTISFAVLIPSLFSPSLDANNRVDYMAFYVTSCVLVLGRLVDYSEEIGHIQRNQNPIYYILYVLGILVSIIASAMSFMYFVWANTISATLVNVFTCVDFVLVLITWLIDTTFFLLFLCWEMRPHNLSDNGNSVVPVDALSSNDKIDNEYIGV